MTMTAENASDAKLIVQVLLRIGEATYELGNVELGCEIPTLHTLLALIVPPEAVSSIPLALRERIATLCARLGETEPPYSQLDLAKAEMELERLQAEEEDLLRTVEEAPAASSDSSSSLLDKGLVRQLKERWRIRTGAQGAVDELLRAWERFKQHVCGETVADRAMRADQYEKLLAALTSPLKERTRR